MSFDEQPDGDPHGECAAEIRSLQEQLETANKKGHEAVLLAMKHEDAAKRASKDALRYRFLRGDCGPSSTRWPRWTLEEFTADGWAPRSAEELDEAIDTALRAMG